jgi:hypothetical protein
MSGTMAAIPRLPPVTATVCPGRTLSGIQLDLIREVKVSTGATTVSRGKCWRQRIIFGSNISILQYGARDSCEELGRAP